MDIMETGDLLHGLSLPNTCTPTRRNEQSKSNATSFNSEFSAAIRSAHEDIDDEEVYFVNGVAQSLSSCGTYAVRSTNGIYIYRDKPDVPPAKLLTHPRTEPINKKLSSVDEGSESLESDETIDIVEVTSGDHCTVMTSTKKKKMKKMLKKKKKYSNNFTSNNMSPLSCDMDNMTVVMGDVDNKIQMSPNLQLPNNNQNSLVSFKNETINEIQSSKWSYPQGVSTLPLPRSYPLRGKGLISRLRRLTNSHRDGTYDSDNDTSASSSSTLDADDLPVCVTNRGPIPIGSAKHRERLQVVEKDGQWLKLARGRGYVGVVLEAAGVSEVIEEEKEMNEDGKENRAGWSKKHDNDNGVGWSLAKVGGPTDKACKIEWMCKTLCRHSKVLRDEVSRLALLRSMLENELQKALAEAETLWDSSQEDSLDRNLGSRGNEKPKKVVGIQDTNSPRKKSECSARYLRTNPTTTTVNYYSDSESCNPSHRSHVHHPHLAQSTNGATASSTTESTVSNNGKKVMETAIKCIDFRTGLSGHLALVSAKTIADRGPGMVPHRPVYRMSQHLGLGTFSSSRGPPEERNRGLSVSSMSAGGLMGSHRSYSACSRMMEERENGLLPANAPRRANIGSDYSGRINSSPGSGSQHVSFHLPDRKSVV